MKTELRQKLVDANPSLFRGGIEIECGPGWYEILLDTAKRLLPFCEGRKDALECFQIKEKYGTLRIYVSWETKAVAEILREAASRSRDTCELCGAPGELFQQFGWWMVRCKVCKQLEGETI